MPAAGASFLWSFDFVLDLNIYIYIFFFFYLWILFKVSKGTTKSY